MSLESLKIDSGPTETSAEIDMISCAGDVLYTPGQLPSGIAQSPDGRQLIEPTAYGLSTIAKLFAATSYHWRLNADTFVIKDELTDAISDFYSGLPIRHAPVCALIRMDNVTLVGGVLYSHLNDKPVIIYETCRPNDRPVVWRAPLDKVLTPNRKTFAAPRWRCFFLGSAGSFNYGHWLVDDLPRLKGMMHLMALDPGPIRVVIESFTAEIDRVRIESIRAMLQFPVHVDLIRRDESFHFDTLYYPTPVSDHPVLKSPAALDFLVRRATETGGISLGDHGRGDRLFVVRSPARGRTLRNGDDVRAMLSSRGFTIIDPENMSFADQVKLFAGAAIVVGQMGAAMTNTVFCRPTTKAIYLAPAGWIEPFYFDLAMTRGHDYRVLFGPVTDVNVPPHQSDFEVSVEALELCLGSM